MSEIKKIGLFGFGTVGKGFYEHLIKNPQIPVSISKVCVKRVDLERIGHELYFTDKWEELLDDPEIDIVIELISDSKAAKEIVETALASGKAVISANKKMIAESLSEVDHWHHTYDKPFLYEAAVGGGIPIISAIDHYFQDQEVTEIKGILNGSSNYILTKMQQQKWSFDRALSEAQKKGFAEANPTLDISGMDASYKLSILAYHAFGQVASLKSCVLENINTITEENIVLAKKASQKIKPVASIKKNGNGFDCSVKPVFVSAGNELFNVDNEDNAISVSTNISGDHLAVGKGAGALPTGSAVLADLRRVLKGYKYELKAKKQAVLA